MTTASPSILAFGPQSDLSDADSLAELRQVLIKNIHLADLCEAIRTLPEVWELLTRSEPHLEVLPGPEIINNLIRWLNEGALLQPLDALQTLYTLPITILVQITVYVRHLHQFEDGQEHRRILERLGHGGSQGFCVGIFAAIAIAYSDSEREIATIGAIGLRIAVCIGAFIDYYEFSVKSSEKAVCVAVRWSEENFSRKKIESLIQPFSQVKTNLEA